jgi:hypothetical protein
MALVGAPVHAGAPAEAIAGSNVLGKYSREATARRSTTEPRLNQATAGNLKALKYNLDAGEERGSPFDFESFGRARTVLQLPEGLDGKGSIGVGQKVQAGTEWSPRLAKWSGPVARLTGDYSRRSNHPLSGPVTLLKRDIQSEFSVGRHRIDVHLSTAF